MEAQPEMTSSVPARGDAGSERSAMSKDSGEGGSKGCSEGSAEGSGEQVVVKEQVKAVVGDLENVLGELKTVVGDLRTLVSQIDVVTSKIDEEYGPDGPDGPDVDMQNGMQPVIDKEIHSRVEAQKSVAEGRSGGVEMRVDKRRRSASLLETGTPKREVPAYVRHSLSQPFDALGPNPKDWVFHAPADFAQKASDSPRHSNHNSRKKDEQHVCPAHRSSCSKIEDILSTPKKDDIIICTPGSQCHKKDHAHHGTPHHTPHRRSSTNNKVDLAIYENVPIVSCRTPSKSSSNNSRSPRTSSGSKGHSPRTSNSSGIGNSNESGNGNTFGSCSKREKSQRHKSHHHHYHHQRPSSTPTATKRSVMVDNTTQVDLSKKLVANYFLSCEDNRKNGLVSVADDLGMSHPHEQFIRKPHGSSSGEVLPLQQQNDPHHCVPCSPSPDSDYCGVYERELDLKLELIFEDDLENCDDRRTLDLQSHPDYGSTYDRERVSRWAAYTLVNIGSLPMSDDQFAETPSDASSDILNDNVFITTAAELRRQQEAKSNWSSVFDRYYRHSLESPDTG